jgi:hypothetical protein
MRKQIMAWLDDIDGTQAAKTVKFSIDGAQYQIDLSADNAAQFDRDLEKWIENASSQTSRRGTRRAVRSARVEAGKPKADRSETAKKVRVISKSATAPTTATTEKRPHKSKTSSVTNKQIRAWAAANKMNVSPRGMIPLPVRRAYRAAHTVIG